MKKNKKIKIITLIIITTLIMGILIFLRFNIQVIQVTPNEPISNVSINYKLNVVNTENLYFRTDHNGEFKRVNIEKNQVTIPLNFTNDSLKLYISLDGYSEFKAFKLNKIRDFKLINTINQIEVTNRVKLNQTDSERYSLVVDSNFYPIKLKVTNLTNKKDEDFIISSKEQTTLNTLVKGYNNYLLEFNTPNKYSTQNVYFEVYRQFGDEDKYLYFYTGSFEAKSITTYKIPKITGWTGDLKFIDKSVEDINRLSSHIALQYTENEILKCSFGFNSFSGNLPWPESPYYVEALRKIINWELNNSVLELVIIPTEDFTIEQCRDRFERDVRYLEVVKV